MLAVPAAGLTLGYEKSGLPAGSENWPAAREHVGVLTARAKAR